MPHKDVLSLYALSRIKRLVKTRQKNCLCPQTAKYPKTNSSKQHCTIKSPQAHRLLIGPVSLLLKIPLPWLLHSIEGKCSLSLHLMGRHWYKKPCSAPGHKKENVYCCGRTKSYFRVRKREGKRERERASHIQLEIPHDLKLPGESPQRVSMEREESILALPVTSQPLQMTANTAAC